MTEGDGTGQTEETLNGQTDRQRDKVGQIEICRRRSRAGRETVRYSRADRQTERQSKAY